MARLARLGSDLGNTTSPRVAASLYWFCTFNNYDELELARLIETADEICDKYVFEKEVGESGTPHIQGKIKMKTKGRPIESFKNKKIHWEKSKCWKGAEYCCKDGTEIGVDIWVKGFDPVLAPKIYGWQLELLELLKHMKERKIYWFHEPKGGVGKTDMCRYLAIKHNALMVGGKSSDMKCAIALMKEKPKLIIINVPRVSHEYISYQGIEEVSDGIFFNGKYESGMVIFNKPKIIVFANEIPEKNKMSLDRWEIYDIIGDEIIKT